jgi:general secretion pathway protein F
MPLFRYHALTVEGRKTIGVIDADTYPLAKERLRKQELMVTRLSLLEKDRQEVRLKPPLLLAFTRELAQLLRAGLPLYESLLTIEEKYRKHRAHPLFLDLCDQLKSGSSLSSALKNYPKTFDGIYVSMITAAEQSGSLSLVLDQLSLLVARQQKLKKQLISALIYPAFLGIFCLLVVFALLFFIIPSMKDLFEGRALHPLTQTVLGLSNWVNEYASVLGLSFLLFLLGAFALWRRKQTRVSLEKLALKTPFFKTLIIQSALIRFCRSASMLLAGGVPLTQALQLSRKVIKNILLESVIEEAEKRIVEGEKLSNQLKLSPFVPSLLVRMLAIAEETGRMAPMLQNVAEIYDEELERSLAQLTTFLQPVLLMILGAVVGLVLLSVLLPLTDVSSFIST